MSKRAYGGVALFPSYKKARVMAQIKTYKRPTPTIKPEKKSHGHNISTTLSVANNVSSGSKVISISSIGTGTDINQRVGRSIRMHSLNVNIDFELGSTAVEYDAGFWAIVQDRRPAGTSVPTLGDVFLSSSTALGYSVFNDNVHPGRFTVLKRGEWQVDIAKGYVQRFNFTVPLKNKESTYRSTTAADFESNCYWLMLASTDLGNIAAPTKVTGISQMNFYDA